MLCAALALFLMVADARFHVVEPARAALALVLHPFQRLLLSPVDAWESFGDYRRGTERAMAAEALARQQLVEQAERLARAAQLQAENQRLRSLLELRPALEVASLSAEVLYEAADPYSRRVVIDRGRSHGVQAGSPVINDAGVLGQVTRVYTLSAEVTLLSDKDAAIPVLNTRTQARNAAFGSSDGQGMELRFLAANADIKPGDLMATSGLDGVYPSGLPVAKVISVERRGDTSFASVRLQPVAQPGQRAPCAGLAATRAARQGQGRSTGRSGGGSRLSCQPQGAAQSGCGRSQARRQEQRRPTMIMPRGAGQLLLPVNPAFIALSVFLALLADMVPIGRFPAMPDFLSVVLVFWGVHQPRRVGVVWAFVLGLMIDIHHGALLGQHALAYSLLSFGAITLHRRLTGFSLGAQALQVLPLFVLAHAVSLLVRLAVGGMWPGWTLLLAPLFETLLWPLASLLLLAPQRRAPDRDAHRPL